MQACPWLESLPQEPEEGMPCEQSPSWGSSQVHWYRPLSLASESVNHGVPPTTNPYLLIEVSQLFVLVVLVFLGLQPIRKFTLLGVREERRELTERVDTDDRELVVERALFTDPGREDPIDLSDDATDDGRDDPREGGAA